MTRVASDHPEAVKFLDALMESVPDTQYLEIRTLKKGGGGRKKFHDLSRLRRHGFESALPSSLDGKENIYYGVCPRYALRTAESVAERGDAVSLGTCIWLDEITRPPPELPRFSWMVETSLGKVQAGYLLKEPTDDLDRLEALNNRLSVAVGGDNVWNRGRILRLPGFINLNHPGDQRAYLLEFHSELRYTLDELDRLIPQLPQERPTGRSASARIQQQTGAFDPHWPYPLPKALQDRLVDFFKGLMLSQGPDGRFVGACPLPHNNGLACDCDQAFYASPVSGSWSCFCSDHMGQTSGTVGAFSDLSFVADYTLSEMQSLIGKNHSGPGMGFAPKREDVANKVKTNKTLYPISDKRRKERGKRSSLWAKSTELFPQPTHVRPRMKGCLLWSEWDRKGLALDLFSNTWRNPANAQFKRQKLYWNMLPRISGLQVYQRKVPVDDWNVKCHKAITRSITRAAKESQGWSSFDNALDRGYFLYLTDVPRRKGFEPVADVEIVLIDALKSIHPPERGEDTSRFRPVLGCDDWIGKADDTGEDDAGRWEIIAVSQKPTDFVGIEAECVVAGVKTEYERPYWRGQPYQGLSMRHRSKEDFVAFAQRFAEQYKLTRAALPDQLVFVEPKESYL